MKKLLLFVVYLDSKFSYSPQLPFFYYINYAIFCINILTNFFHINTKITLSFFKIFKWTAFLRSITYIIFMIFNTDCTFFQNFLIKAFSLLTSYNSFFHTGFFSSFVLHIHIIDSFFTIILSSSGIYSLSFVFNVFGILKPPKRRAATSPSRTSKRRRPASQPTSSLRALRWDV